ncbi:MAG: tRNA pseudouridine(55) synthase TruB [Thermoleophilaceae bacterium]
MSSAVDGVVLYDKPAGITSHDVVRTVRRGLDRKTKVGHAGTLDPFASGLLLVLVGAATRAQRFLLVLPKTYRAVARLGFVSSTGDSDGELVATGRFPEALELPRGRLMQRPPAHSAVKVGGERLYEKARRGEPVEGAPRPVTVHRAELLWHEGDRASFEIECSSGTYVRQLIAGLGDAYCEELERIAIGPFSLADANPEHVLPLGDALEFLPSRALSSDEAGSVAHGMAIAGRGAMGDAIRLTFDGSLHAIARAEGGELRPYVVFAR